MAPAPASSPGAQSQPEFADSYFDLGRGAQGIRKKSWLSNIFD